MSVTKDYKVFGDNISLSPSVKWDWSDESAGTRIFEAINSDITGCSDFSIVRITRDTEEECDKEINGQISDGYFEDKNVDKIMDLTHRDKDIVSMKKKKADELWEKFADIPIDPETERIEEPFTSFDIGTHKEKIWHWFEDTFDISVHELIYSDDKEK